MCGGRITVVSGSTALWTGIEPCTAIRGIRCTAQQVCMNAFVQHRRDRSMPRLSSALAQCSVRRDPRSRVPAVTKTTRKVERDVIKCTMIVLCWGHKPTTASANALEGSV